MISGQLRYSTVFMNNGVGEMNAIAPTPVMVGSGEIATGL